MLFFRSEEHLNHWLAAGKRARGATLTLDQTWHLSRLWYGDRMAADFKGRSLTGAAGIFKEVGLDGPFWAFEDTIS